MADLFTQFSCLLHVATAENAAAADLICKSMDLI
jgi:hypothetical protein